jgi:phage terminase large subunit
LRGLGLKVAPCKKYAGCVAYRIKWLQSKILVIDPQRTPNAFNEFSTYEYVTTKDGEFTTDVPDANNHTIDALAYALDRLINSKHNSA